jgi:hypothetical protein
MPICHRGGPVLILGKSMLEFVVDKVALAQVFTPSILVFSRQCHDPR